MELLKAFYALRESVSKDRQVKCFGICTIIEGLLGIDSYVAHRKLFLLFATWPKYSGDPIYPVPSVNKKKSARKYYGDTKDMWKGKYGKLRIELMNHCIEQLEKQQKELQQTKDIAS